MFLLLNIVLPTVDVITDSLMIAKLLRGAYGCVNPRWWSEEHEQWQLCLEDPELFCTNRDLGGSNATCYRTTEMIFKYHCRDPYKWSRDYQDWKACTESPTNFCSKRCGEPGGNTSSNGCGDVKICEFEHHPKFGITLMIPFLLNYAICFITWCRLEKRKKETFLFPLINMYSQSGRSIENISHYLNNY